MIARTIRFAALNVLMLLMAASASAQVFDAGGNVTMGVGSSGEVSVWGYGGFGQTTGVPTGSDFKAVSAGRDHAAALRTDGTAVSWGHALGDPSTPYPVAPTESGFTAITSGGYHTLALRSNGTVAGWGANASNQIAIPAALENVTAISAGIYHSLALKDDGTVVAWGLNADGQTMIPAWGEDLDAIAIAGGGYHSLALLSDGTVSAWGQNHWNQRVVPGGLSGVAAITAGEHHSLALRSDGTVAAWGDNTNDQVAGAEGLTDVVHVNAGLDHNYAIHSDGSLTAWGWNGVNQQNTPSSFALPTVTHWSTATDGDYLHSHRWEQQIPSTAISTAHFDAEGDYTVTFGNDAKAANLIVSAGDVSFSQNGYAYDVTNDITVSGAGTALRVDGAISANTVHNSGLISIASGGVLTANSLTNAGTLINSGVVNGALTMADGGVLSGTGSITGMLTVSDGASLAPGASVGLIQGTDTTFGSGGSFDFEINDAMALPGGPLGWDTLQLTGVLTITADPSNQFIIDISTLDLNDAPGLAANFDSGQNYSWAFVTANGGIEGFDADLFSIHSSGFQNDIGGGHFSVGQAGNSLMLQFNSSLSAVPEPSSLAVLGMCGLGWAGYRLRNRKRERTKVGEAAEVSLSDNA